MIISLKDKPVLANPEAVFSILKSVLAAEQPADQDKEHFWVFYLTPRNTIKVLELVGLGTLDCCPVHPREVFTQAITHRCASILVAHNHPSGDPTPSSNDIEVTERLSKAGEILGIQVIDHLIVTKDSFSSLKQEGHL